MMDNLEKKLGNNFDSLVHKLIKKFTRKLVYCFFLCASLFFIVLQAKAFSLKTTGHISFPKELSCALFIKKYNLFAYQDGKTLVLHNCKTRVSRIYEYERKIFSFSLDYYSNMVHVYFLSETSGFDEKVYPLGLSFWCNRDEKVEVHRLNFDFLHKGANHRGLYIFRISKNSLLGVHTANNRVKVLTYEKEIDRYYFTESGSCFEVVFTDGTKQVNTAESICRPKETVLHNFAKASPEVIEKIRKYSQCDLVCVHKSPDNTYIGAGFQDFVMHIFDKEGDNVLFSIKNVLNYKFFKNAQTDSMCCLAALGRKRWIIIDLEKKVVCYGTVIKDSMEKFLTFYLNTLYNNFEVQEKNKQYLQAIDKTNKNLFYVFHCPKDEIKNIQVIETPKGPINNCVFIKDKKNGCFLAIDLKKTVKKENNVDSGYRFCTLYDLFSGKKHDLEQLGFNKDKTIGYFINKDKKIWLFDSVKNVILDIVNKLINREGKKVKACRFFDEKYALVIFEDKSYVFVNIQENILHIGNKISIAKDNLFLTIVLQNDEILLLDDAQGKIIKRYSTRRIFGSEKFPVSTIEYLYEKERPYLIVFFTDKTVKIFDPKTGFLIGQGQVEKFSSYKNDDYVVLDLQQSRVALCNILNKQIHFFKGEKKLWSFFINEGNKYFILFDLFETEVPSVKLIDLSKNLEDITVLNNVAINSAKSYCAFTINKKLILFDVKQNKVIKKCKNSSKNGCFLYDEVDGSTSFCVIYDKGCLFNSRDNFIEVKEIRKRSLKGSDRYFCIEAIDGYFKVIDGPTKRLVLEFKPGEGIERKNINLLLRKNDYLQYNIFYIKCHNSSALLDGLYQKPENKNNYIVYHCANKKPVFYINGGRDIHVVRVKSFDAIIISFKDTLSPSICPLGYLALSGARKRTQEQAGICDRDPKRRRLI